MRYILTESQYNLILEQTSGLDELMSKIKEKYGVSDEHLDIIKQFILNSDCKKISVEPIKHGLGVSLSDRVVLSPLIFNNSLPKFLFVLFHEIAHQYQFKKYGGEKMFECYIGEITPLEGAELMRKVELVADEFAVRKLREFVKLGVVKSKDAKFGGFYKNITPEYFVGLITQIKNSLKSNNITDPNKICEFFYNWVKLEINN